MQGRLVSSCTRGPCLPSQPLLRCSQLHHTALPVLFHRPQVPCHDHRQDCVLLLLLHALLGSWGCLIELDVVPHDLQGSHWHCSPMSLQRRLTLPNSTDRATKNMACCQSCGPR